MEKKQLFYKKAGVARMSYFDRKSVFRMRCPERSQDRPGRQDFDAGQQRFGKDSAQRFSQDSKPR